MQVYHVDEYNPEIYKKHPRHGYYAPVEIEVDPTFVNDTDWLEGTFHVRNEWYWDYSDGWVPDPSGQYVYKKQEITFTITNNDLNHDLHLILHVEEIEGDDGITLVNGSDVNSMTYEIDVPAGTSLNYVVTVYDYLPFLRWGVWEWWAEVENVTQYLRAGANITLTAEDPGECPSGIEAIYWRYVWNDTEYPQEGEYGAINGSQFAIYGYDEEITGHWWYVVYDDSTTISFDEECRHDLYYFAKDRACHNSTVHHQVYYVDASEPVVEEILPEHGAIGNTTQSLFEGFYIPFGNGWAVVNGSTSYWELKTNEPDYNYHDMDASHSGVYYAMAWKNGGTADTWLITPKVHIPEDGNLTFWYATYYSSYNEAAFEVCINNVSTQTDTSAFVPVWDSGTFGDTTYRKVEIDLSKYAGQDVYIGFHCYYLEQDYYYGGLVIDDVWIGGIHRIATLLDDDVEDSMAWTIDDLTVDGSFWQQVDRIPVYNTTPPAPSMWCGDLSLENAPNGFGRYACNWNDTLTLKNPLNLSDVNGPVTFEFWYWIYTEFKHDWLYVEASNDSENWSILTSITGGSSSLSTPWSKATIDLSDYIGNDTVWVRFRFYSDDSHSTVYNGVFIDNVSIYNSTHTFLSDTFDNPWVNWVAEMLETSKWHIVSTDAHSPTHSWWNGNDATGQYFNCIDDALVSPIIDLSGYTYEEAMLTFWHKRNFYEDADYGVLEVRYSNDGTTWSAWDDITYYRYDRNWVQEFIDLSDYIGYPQKVQFRFRFVSDTDGTDYGWYIDDIRFELRNITETVFEDNFERTFPPAGWSESGSYTTYFRYGWSHIQMPEITVASIEGDDYYTQDEWLITPVIYNLPKFSNLTFMHNLNLDGASAYVYIKLDNGTWQLLATLSDTGGMYVIEDISLWPYRGHDVQLAFRFVTNYGDGSGSYWAIEWVNVTSLGFLRACAPVTLNAYDLPENDCRVGVSALYWRYEWSGGQYPYPYIDDALGMSIPVVPGSSIPGVTPDDEDIYDYYWYYIEDNGPYDLDDRVGYISYEVHFYEDCIHDLYYFAKDWVCHSSEVYHDRWYVDGTAPYTELTVEWADHPAILKDAKIHVAIYDSSIYGPGSYFDGAEGNNWDEFLDVL
ncbi:MAG: hypothetical protein DRN92_06625, partial [Thermoproteota archaeon]